MDNTNFNLNPYFGQIEYMSSYFVHTLREAPEFADTQDYQYLIRGNYIARASAGIFTWLPLGLRVLRRLENVIREEIEKTGAKEVLFPGLLSADAFKATGRWEEYGDGIFRIVDRHQRDHLLAPTHEEMFTILVRDMISSYKDLPLVLYQIQTKYRDEIRPRAGLMRGREFVMKDSYTFDLTEQDLQIAYDKQRAAYFKIFERLDVPIKAVTAVSGAMGGSRSEEFVADLESGEDKYVLAPSGYAANVETIQEAKGDPDYEVKEGDPSPDGSGGVKIVNCVELGHIFALGQKYTKAFDFQMQDASGELKRLWMGSYGIGVTRLLAYMAMRGMDDRGLCWHKEITPFDVHLIVAGKGGKEQVSPVVEKLVQANKSVLVDDRDVSMGVKFKDAELIGIPAIVVAGKNLQDGLVEVKDRASDHKQDVELTALATYLDKK